MTPKLFTKKLFIDTINALDKQYSIDEKAASAIGEIFPGGFIGGYNNSAITSRLMEILQTEFPPDASGHCDIEYFMFDLDFGRKWKKGMVTDHGRDIRLSTPARLWNYLIKR